MRKIFFLIRLLLIIIAVLIGLRIFNRIQGRADELQSRWVLCQTFVNVRARASMNSSSIGHVMLGDELTVDQTVRRGGRWWYHCTDVANEYGSGWVCADYCTDSAVTVCDETATVNASGRVALRVSVNGKRRAWVKPGAELDVIGYSDTWALTTKGYIKMEFLEFSPTEDEGGDPDGAE